MSEKIETIIPNDPTGLLNNISELAEHSRKKELNEVLIIYTRTDNSTRTYWNGDNMKCIALTEMAKADLLKNYLDEGSYRSYDLLPKKKG